MEQVRDRANTEPCKSHVTKKCVCRVRTHAPCGYARRNHERRDDSLKAARTHPRARSADTGDDAARGGLGCPHLARFHQGQAAALVNSQHRPPFFFLHARGSPVLAQLSDSIDRAGTHARTRLLSGHQVDRHSAGPAGRSDRSIHRCTFGPLAGQFRGCLSVCLVPKIL